MGNIDELRDRLQYAAYETSDEAVEKSILSLEALCTCKFCTSTQKGAALLHEKSRDYVLRVAYAI